jgi:serine/threonine-protein kinase
MSTLTDTCGEIIQSLADVKLLGPTEVEAARQFVSQFPTKPPRDMVAFLVAREFVTRFQGDIALRGAAQQLVMPPFVLTEILGSGSMGQTAKAKSLEDGAWYALKAVPRKNILNLKTIDDQIGKLKAIRHPRVSAMTHVGVHEDRVFMVWPFIEGGEKLDDIVKRQGRLAPRAAVQVAQQIASGLEEYHAHGLFHGLLKPSDILIGSDRRVRLLDFGVGFLLTCERGKSLLDTTTNSKAMNRGVDCASPESILDPLDRTVLGDQYSLGCILYFCLTGQYPFPDTNPVKKMLGHQFEEPTPIRDLVPELPRKLESVVARMLAKKPAYRFPNIEAVIQEFRKVTPELGEAAPPRPGSKAVAPEPPKAVPKAVPKAAPKAVPSTNRAVAPSRMPARPAPAPTPAPAKRKSTLKARRMKVFVLGAAGLVAGLAGGVLTWWMMRG